METILENIRNIRLSKGYTQDFIAEKLGIDPVNYGRIERGQAKLTIDRFIKICEILEVEPIIFFENNEDKIISYLKLIYKVEKEILKILQNI